MNNPNRTRPDRPEKKALAWAPSGHWLPIVEKSFRPIVLKKSLRSNCPDIDREKRHFCTLLREI
ncbi:MULTISPECIES: hypothetical protein [unclassified Pseudomonas]|uniref:hypothetical protein n=1 Tax=unclassified Pseudomonas TaxID=196821 RepID=UPI0030D89CE2